MKMPLVWKCLKDETGASAVEYALLIGLIAVVIVTAVSTLGNTLSTTYNSMATAFAS